jgi:hypothetical protein
MLIDDRVGDYRRCVLGCGLLKADLVQCISTQMATRTSVATVIANAMDATLWS